jgi:hypothetical protein
MILEAGRSGKGMWLTPPQVALYDAIYNARVATPLGIEGE